MANLFIYLLDLYLNNTSCMFLPNFGFTTEAFNHLLIKPLYYINFFNFTPKHTVHCLWATVVCLLRLFLVSRIHCYRKKKVFF